MYCVYAEEWGLSWWRPEDSVQESVPSFHHVYSWIKLRLPGLASKCLHLLSHLTDPQNIPVL